MNLKKEIENLKKAYKNGSKEAMLKLAGIELGDVFGKYNLTNKEAVIVLKTSLEIVLEMIKEEEEK